MAFHIYNTMSRKKEELVPLDGKKIRMYTCGPTVYNYAHIGNFRAYMFEDLLRRYIQFAGFEVEQVQNLTDVDDKTIRHSIEQGKSLNEFTALYKEAFFHEVEIPLDKAKGLGEKLAFKILKKGGSKLMEKIM